jgi:hypothetical protein
VVAGATSTKEACRNTSCNNQSKLEQQRLLRQIHFKMTSTNHSFPRGSHQAIE